MAPGRQRALPRTRQTPLVRVRVRVRARVRVRVTDVNAFDQ